jgi:tight adherence protein B
VVVSHQVGGDLAGTLDMLAATLRERAQVEERIMALTAMGRMQGRVMMVLPVAVGGMLYLQQPLIMVRLVTEPIGWAVIALAAGMMGVASVAIRRIVAIDV